jgi:hypothetical protein
MRNQQIAEALRRNPTLGMLANRAKEVGKQYPVNTMQPSTQPRLGPGGARFGAGAGGPNRFDYTQYGGGLWSIGIDPNAPDVDAKAQQWFNSQPANVQAEVRKGLAGGKSLTWATDWRARDVARKIQKSNNFFDSTLGKVVGVALPMGLGAIAAPLGIAASAGIGGATGGLPGAALGALGSAVAPAIKAPVSSFMRAPVQAATNVAKQFANPVAAGRQALASGLSAWKRGNA